MEGDGNSLALGGDPLLLLLLLLLSLLLQLLLLLLLLQLLLSLLIQLSSAEGVKGAGIYLTDPDHCTGCIGT